MKTKSAKRQIRLAISSNAGGSGKTTMAVHLAYAVGAKGYKVTVIELDHNGSLQILAGLPPASSKTSLASVLKKQFKGIIRLFLYGMVTFQQLMLYKAENLWKRVLQSFITQTANITR